MTAPLELDVNLLIAAAETDDEIGLVLRIHLLVEKVLIWYIGLRIQGELVGYVKGPREFGGKLSLAAAFGLPVAFVRAIHQVNVIRNQLAHGSSTLMPDQVQQLERQVNRLCEMDANFVPPRKRFVELPQKRPGEQIPFGSGGPSADFFIASLAFLGFAMTWAEAIRGLPHSGTTAPSAPLGSS